MYILEIEEVKQHLTCASNSEISIHQLLQFKSMRQALPHSFAEKKERKKQMQS